MMLSDSLPPVCRRMNPNFDGKTFRDLWDATPLDSRWGIISECFAHNVPLPVKLLEHYILNSAASTNDSLCLPQMDDICVGENGWLDACFSSPLVDIGGLVGLASTFQELYDSWPPSIQAKVSAEFRASVLLSQVCGLAYEQTPGVRTQEGLMELLGCVEKLPGAARFLELLENEGPAGPYLQRKAT